MGTRTDRNDWPSDPWLSVLSTQTVSLGVLIEGEEDAEDMVVGVREGLTVTAVRFDGDKRCCGTAWLSPIASLTSILPLVVSMFPVCDLCEFQSKCESKLVRFTAGTAAQD
jgi:hypothetical protein